MHDFNAGLVASCVTFHLESIHDLNVGLFDIRYFEALQKGKEDIICSMIFE